MKTPPEDRRATESPLTGKLILGVDDEPDVLDLVAEVLDRSIIHKARDFDTARDYLLMYSYDIVILDIMGVRGFELLKMAVMRGFPAVMLTAHALSPEALKKAIKLGAVSFLPKEAIPDLPSHLEDVVLGAGKPVWKKLFKRIGGLFDQRFGPDWKEKDRFLKEFVAEVTKKGVAPK
jgi:CheY-like chemotaxis protein